MSIIVELNTSLPDGVPVNAVTASALQIPAKDIYIAGRDVVFDFNRMEQARVFEEVLRFHKVKRFKQNGLSFTVPLKELEKVKGLKEGTIYESRAKLPRRVPLNVVTANALQIPAKRISLREDDVWFEFKDQQGVKVMASVLKSQGIRGFHEFDNNIIVPLFALDQLKRISESSLFEKKDRKLQKFQGRKGHWYTADNGQRYFKAQDGEILGAPDEFIDDILKQEQYMDEMSYLKKGASPDASIDAAKELVSKLAKEAGSDYVKKMVKKALAKIETAKKYLKYKSEAMASGKNTKKALKSAHNGLKGVAKALRSKGYKTSADEIEDAMAIMAKALKRV